MKPRWRIATKPDTEDHLWVSDNGQVSWDAPSPEDILTLEQRFGTDIPHPDEVVWKLQQLLDKTRTPESAKEIFNLFGHGVLFRDEHAAAHQSIASEIVKPGSEAPTAPVSKQSSDWTCGKRYWVCNRSVTECYQAKIDSVPQESKGYQLDTADAESAADKAAQLMTELASTRAAAETLDCKVFFWKGLNMRNQKWFNAAQEEMDERETGSPAA